MRQRLRPRINKRSAVAVALAMAGTFGVGSIAFPASSAATPPLVPACTPKASTGNDSCVTLKVSALDGSIGTTLENARLGFRTPTVFDPPSYYNSDNEVSTLTLRFDDLIALNLAGIPVCGPAEVAGTNIAQAYEQCGPGADGNPPSEGNAFLSPPGNVSGIASSVPVSPFGADIPSCVMAFRGPNWDPPPAGPPLFPTLTLYFRAPVGNPPSECDNPATNTAGNQVLVLQGFFTREAASSPYDWRLRVPNFHGVNIPIDDFYVTLTRGATVRARCPTSTYKHKLVGIFDYSGTQATDIIAPPYPGTTDTCP